MTNIEIYASEYMEEAKVDFVGLWQLVARVQNDLGPDNFRDVRRFTLDLVGVLISRGLVPGDYTSAGFTFWNGSERSLLDRVASEWDQLPDGKLPQLGDTSCWFALRPK